MRVRARGRGRGRGRERERKREREKERERQREKGYSLGSRMCMSACSLEPRVVAVLVPSYGPAGLTPQRATGSRPNNEQSWQNCEETTKLEDSLHDGRWCYKAHPYGVIDLEFRGTLKTSDTPCTSDQLFERSKQCLNTIVKKEHP